MRESRSDLKMAFYHDTLMSAYEDINRIISNLSRPEHLSRDENHDVQTLK
jgi:hypothetical protein